MTQNAAVFHNNLRPVSSSVIGFTVTTDCVARPVPIHPTLLGNVRRGRIPPQSQKVNVSRTERSGRAESPQYCRVSERNLRHA